MKVRFAVAPHGGLREAGHLIAFAEAVEANGFDGVWLSDLPVGPGVDPLLGLALIAGRTERVRLGANVVPLGRNPFLLAKGLAQLDQISGGRLLLSFVPGLGLPAERAALGWDGADRGTVLERVLGVARSWWAGALPVDGPRPKGLPRSFVRSRTHSRYGSAGAGRRPSSASAGSPTGGSGRSSLRRRPVPHAWPSTARQNAPDVGWILSISA